MKNQRLLIPPDAKIKITHIIDPWDNKLKNDKHPTGRYGWTFRSGALLVWVRDYVMVARPGCYEVVR